MTQTLQVGILYGIAAAILFGSGDYLGGRAAKGIDIRRVMLASQCAALVVSGLGSLVVRGAIRPSDLAYGVGAGLSAAVGLGLLYRALAVGRAGLVAPLTAVTGALVPVTWGVTRGERPSALAMVGVVVAVSAAALIAREQTETDVGPAGAGIALAAGLALGLGFVCYASTSGDSGLWPLVSSRVASVAFTAVVFAALRSRGTRNRWTGASFASHSQPARSMPRGRSALSQVCAPNSRCLWPRSARSRRASP